MKLMQRRLGERALTLVEILMIGAVLFVLFGVFMPLPGKRKIKGARIKCINNLKNIGLSFRISILDGGAQYLTHFPVAVGGTKDFAGDPSMTWAHFAALSNELNTPKLLLCPDDKAGRTEATTFDRSATNKADVSFSQNSNLSYFVSLDGDETRPEMMLSGDRNITNLVPTRFAYGLAQVGPLGTNHTAVSGAGWDRNVHKLMGNVAMANGSVQQLNSELLRKLLRSTRDTNGNRIAVPD